ncbi:MAG TPA: hypothetical protein DEF57_00870 [Candidatus Magasanikbacteria bacterium]|nr:hypothetical protein [Candidatus Magasanikbacteria bacterium]
MASHYYEPISNWTLSITGGNFNIVKFIVFIILFIIANRLVGFIFWLVEKVFSVLKIIPFLGTINRLLGGLLGLFEGVLVVGLTLFFISKFPLSEWLTGSMLKSGMAAYLIKISSILWPLLPAALKQIQSIM